MIKRKCTGHLRLLMAPTPRWDDRSMGWRPGGRTVQPKGRVPRQLVALILTSFVVIETIGSVVLAKGDKPAGVFLIVIGVLFTGFYLALMLVWGVLRDPAAGGEPTGRIMAWVAPGDGTWLVEPQKWTWTGGGNVPGSIGRVNATFPFAALELSGSALTLRIRPKAIGGIFGAGSFTWMASDLVVIYPVRDRWVRFNRGLAIESAAGLCYFWAVQPEPLLAALERHHFPVSWGERVLKLALV
jgi:hypothetical protein